MKVPRIKTTNSLNKKVQNDNKTQLSKAHAWWPKFNSVHSVADKVLNPKYQKKLKENLKAPIVAGMEAKNEPSRINFRRTYTTLNCFL